MRAALPRPRKHGGGPSVSATQIIRDTMTNNKMIAATEIAEELGWPILPCWWIDSGKCACGQTDCGSPGKHPLAKLVPSGLKNASSDPVTVAEWWRRYPEANPAIRTGDALWSLDLDGLPGIRAFNQIAETHDDLPETPTALTGGGGKHIYFAPDERIRNAAKIKGCAIDARGVNGYILCPPSDHKSGTPYRWERPATKYDLEPAPFWLIDLVTGGDASGNSSGPAMVMTGSLDDQPGAGKGQRNDMLCRLVGGYLRENGADGKLFDQAIAWGNRCQPPMPEGQVRKSVMALAQKHAANTPLPTERKILMASYSDIEPEDVVWLWRDRIPSRKLSIFCGDPGQGKSFVSLDIASRVSAGVAFPDGSPCEQGKVIICSCEDGPADTIRPRLDAMGANVANVFNFEGMAGDNGQIIPFRLDQDIPTLDNYLDDMPGVALLIIDPVSGFMGAVDSHVNAAVRGVLAPLAKLAEKHSLAVVAITHLSKGQGKALHKVMGSLAYIAAARTGWGVVTDPDDDDRKLFLPVKNNLAKATGLAYRIVDGRIEWEPAPVLITIDDLDNDSETPRSEAAAWLEGTLKDGPATAKDILKQAKADGICERTLRYAKKELEVISRRDGDFWKWELPQTDQDCKAAIFRV